MLLFYASINSAVSFSVRVLSPPSAPPLLFLYFLPVEFNKLYAADVKFKDPFNGGETVSFRSGIKHVLALITRESGI